MQYVARWCNLSFFLSQPFLKPRELGNATSYNQGMAASFAALDFVKEAPVTHLVFSHWTSLASPGRRGLSSADWNQLQEEDPDDTGNTGSTSAFNLLWDLPWQSRILFEMKRSPAGSLESEWSVTVSNRRTEPTDHIFEGQSHHWIMASFRSFQHVRIRFSAWNLEQ